MKRPPDPLEGLFDRSGRRKYLCGNEGRRFLAAATKLDAESRVFCQLLAYTGCRVSEALSLTPERLDPESCCVIFLTLKRRARCFRAVPVPQPCMTSLLRLAKLKSPGTPLWSWCRQTAWRRVKVAMGNAGIVGAQASPKGLRHGFGIANAEKNIPAALTQRWMGHARLETTAIYQHAVGSEERAFARRLWRRLPG